MRSSDAACNGWCNSRGARLGVLALMLACGGRSDGEAGGADAEAQLPLEGDLCF